ncbi:hypothetical protein GGQ74_001953 [Desulfobaculum xiamenense]|uniref:Uncharacterized protein n=1 Tax=Desulfobaculum xiamenense TaxID=995050 RepID=A0A846QMM8_9BACT|nr:hypothetical protein [Desulfobaculum xiamenense]NJB68280.1 hypothetical protein [Desulfobaculum xiamenense]
MEIGAIGSGVQSVFGTMSGAPGTRASRGGATSQEAFDRAVEKEREERERSEAEAAALPKQGIDYVREYVRSKGAPEELERDRAEESFLEYLQREGEDPKKHLPGLAHETLAMAVQDPEDEGKVHVYATKIDAKGNGKITRSMSFDSGDGEDRSQLTPARRRAMKAYAEAAADEDATRAEGERTTRREKRKSVV